MKILSYAWYIADTRLPQYADNCTGAGRVIRDLCEFLGRRETSYLFIGQYTFSEKKLGNISLVGTDHRADMKKSRGRDDAYTEYMTDIFGQTVDEVVPDVILFHDLGDLAYSIITKICIPRGLKYAAACHLYIGRRPEFAGYEGSLPEEERMMGIRGLNLVTVSSGMKRKILRDYPGYDESRIIPILNGTDFKADILESDYRERLGAGTRKILLCVGTVCYRKNQLQILSTFQKYGGLRENVLVVFCGKIAGTMKEDFGEEIEKRGLGSCMKYIGALSGDEMKKLYSASDGLVMPSYSEGLSIAALEAVAYGLPVIMFRDLECAPDLEDENVAVLAEDRTDECLAGAIAGWYGREWDKEYILEYAGRFTMERMADGYLDYFGKLLHDG